MNKFVIALLSIFFTSFSFGCDENSAKSLLAKLQWQTEDYPPYNYLDKSGDLIGIFPEVLLLTYNKLGINIKINDIAVVPWARLLRNTESYPDHAAFSMVTTPERANKYKLVSLPVVMKMSIMVLSQNKDILQKKSIDELVIAVVRGDIGQALLNRQKILAKQIETTSAYSLLKMLVHNRVDAIAYSEDVAYFQFKKLNIKKNTIVPIYLLDDKSVINFIFHKSTPDCAINIFKKAIISLNHEGKLQPVWEKHLQN